MYLCRRIIRYSSSYGAHIFCLIFLTSFLYIAKISTHITPALNKSSIEDEEESKLLNKKQIMERRLIEEEQEKLKKNSK